MTDFKKNLAEARNLCLKAKVTNEAQDAWKLVDFMYNQLLTQDVKIDIEDSLSDFMAMLKTDLEILKNREKYHRNACLSTPEEIVFKFSKMLYFSLSKVAFNCLSKTKNVEPLPDIKLPLTFSLISLSSS